MPTSNREALERANENWGPAGVLDAAGNPMRVDRPASIDRANPNYGRENTSGNDGGGPCIDIVKLQAEVSWLWKALYGLSAASLAVAVWLFINLYGPLNQLGSNLAVQTALLTELKASLSDVKARIDKRDDIAADGSRRK